MLGEGGIRATSYIQILTRVPSCVRPRGDNLVQDPIEAGGSTEQERRDLSSRGL